MSTTTKERLQQRYKNIVVIPFNMDAMDKDLDEHIKKTYPDKVEENEFFSLHSVFGLIKDSKILIDRECIGNVLENGKVTLEAYGEKRTEGGKLEFDIFPRFSFVVTIEELIKEYAQPEVSLETFMGDRFAYNGRIINNMEIISKELNKQPA